MHSFKTIVVLLATVAMLSASPSMAETTRRNLRAEHNGEDHSVPAAAPMVLTNSAPTGPTTTTNTNNAAQTILTPGTNTNTNTNGNTANVTPGSSTSTNVNVMPSTANTNVVVTPGSAPAMPAGGAGGAVAPRPAAAPVPQQQPAGAKPSPAGGLGFGSLNPLTMVATLAHQAHGALLGHTGTLPSSYMQGKSGAAGGHH